MPLYSEQPVISVKGLKKRFDTNIVLDGFDLDVHKGENVVVLGRSGSGKSVLIKCIIGLLRPDAGSIHVLGADILTMDHEELDKMRTRIGFLFQSNALYDSMTIRENLEFPMRRNRIDITQKEMDNRVQDVLSHVGLAHTADMMPASLSGGMQKRIALARTLILKPDIILYDEPTSGLDPITGREISALMVQTREQYQTSSIIISHDMKCVKATGDYIAVLAQGKCHAMDTYDNLATTADPLIKQFFE